MGRWNNYNDVEYKGQNLCRRDLLENINYDNAFWILTYAKYLIDEKGKKHIFDSQLRNIYSFLEFLYEERENMSLLDVTEKEAEDFMYYLSINKKYQSVTTSIRIYSVSAFYDFLILKEATTENPFLRTKNLATMARGKKKDLKTNFLTDEHIEKIKTELPDYLRLYAMFSLTSGAKSEHIRNMKWSQVDFEKRIVMMGEDTLYFSEEVSELLRNEQNRRIEKGLNDYGYVFRSRLDAFYEKDYPIAKSTISSWCAEIGQLLEIPNLKHIDFRFTVIQKLLTVSGSVGMTSIILNYPFLSQRARLFTSAGEKNNELLQEYKDICEL